MGFFKNKSGVDLVTGFKLHSSQLLDLRQNVDTIEDRDALITEFNITKGGLRVFVEETKKSYIYNGESWDEIPTLTTELHAVATSGDYNDLINKPKSLPADGGTASTVNVPIGTILLSASSSATFFNTCFGGTWEVMGNIDTLVGSTSMLLYMFKKTAN